MSVRSACLIQTTSCPTSRLLAHKEYVSVEPRLCTPIITPTSTTSPIPGAKQSPQPHTRIKSNNYVSRRLNLEAENTHMGNSCITTASNAHAHTVSRHPLQSSRQGGRACPANPHPLQNRLRGKNASQVRRKILYRRHSQEWQDQKKKEIIRRS